ncbi:MAG TPA: UDP-glucose 4-epimerase GalE [Stellaceae bacterium]|jgi:UDP-arabinose 4-epimerase|nr:UDP-glucose 4-epimerase GalE [Stellaceae bacterium]
MSQSILVTGGAGYVGSHACKALATAGYRPIVYDNLSRGYREAVRWGPLVEGDLHDRATLVDTMRAHDVTAIMHFAAFAYVGESVGNPELYYTNNVGGTLSLLGAMHDAGVERIVFSSTCAVYGVPDRLPISEATAKAPLNPYGETKLAIERALHWYAGAYGFRYAALRYFNAAGGDPDGEVGENHEPETHLIPLILRAALQRGDPIGIFGTDYPTPDGTAIRDYIHVADLADAHVRALDYLAGGGDSAALNLGTGHGHSVREVIAAVERVGQRPVPQREMPRRAGDPPELVADPALAFARLGWQARHSDIDTIIATALAWETRSNGPPRSGQKP